jgi:hypothetical protein
MLLTSDHDLIFYNKAKGAPIGFIVKCRVFSPETADIFHYWEILSRKSQNYEAEERFC